LTMRLNRPILALFSTTTAFAFSPNHIQRTNFHGVSVQQQGLRRFQTELPSLRELESEHKHEFRVIALDLDETLCTSDGSVGPQTIAALTKFVNQPVDGTRNRCVFATGRGIDYSTKLVDQLQEQGLEIDGLVVSEGGLVMARDHSHDQHPGRWEECYCDMMKSDVLSAVVDQISSEIPGACFAADMDGDILISHAEYFAMVQENDPLFYDKFLKGKDPTPDFRSRLGSSHSIAWMWVLHPTIPTAELQPQIARIVERHTRNDNATQEVTVTSAPITLGEQAQVGAVTLKQQANKRIGLQVLAERWGLEPADFLAFGDAANDLDMFAWVGRSVCPANAQECAKVRATETSGLTNDEEFIADALERYYG